MHTIRVQFVCLSQGRENYTKGGNRDWGKILRILCCISCDLFDERGDRLRARSFYPNIAHIALIARAANIAVYFPSIVLQSTLFPVNSHSEWDPNVPVSLV